MISVVLASCIAQTSLATKVEVTFVEDQKRSCILSRQMRSPDPQSAGWFQTLPRDVLKFVGKQLKWEDLSTLAQTCQFLNIFSQEERARLIAEIFILPPQDTTKPWFFMLYPVLLRQLWSTRDIEHVRLGTYQAKPKSVPLIHSIYRMFQTNYKVSRLEHLIYFHLPLSGLRAKRYLILSHAEDWFPETSPLSDSVLQIQMPKLAYDLFLERCQPITQWAHVLFHPEMDSYGRVQIINAILTLTPDQSVSRIEMIEKYLDLIKDAHSQRAKITAKLLRLNPGEISKRMEALIPLKLTSLWQSPYQDKKYILMGELLRGGVDKIQVIIKHIPSFYREDISLQFWVNYIRFLMGLPINEISMRLRMD